MEQPPNLHTVKCCWSCQSSTVYKEEIYCKKYSTGDGELRPYHVCSAWGVHGDMIDDYPIETAAGVDVSCWISLADHGPPPKETWCWVYTKDNRIFLAKSGEGAHGWSNEDTWEDFERSVTHYMLLVKPEPPHD